MAILQIVWAKRLSKAGSALGRAGLSKRATEIMVELVTKTGSYKAAMVAVGRLKAIAAAAKYDDYWTEQVDDGFHKELHFLEELAKRHSLTTHPLQPDDAGFDATPVSRPHHSVQQEK